MKLKFRHIIHYSLTAILLLFLLGANIRGWGQTTQNYSVNGNFIVPAGVNSIKIEAWGGGGGGGGCRTNNGNRYGSGGGGGAYDVAYYSVASGDAYTINVGTGGTAAADANGGNGNPSTITGPAGTVTANPGRGGARRQGAGGAGGTGYNNGGTGGTATTNGAGGGGGAGNATPTGTGIGGNGSNTATGTGGLGNPNNSPYIGGNGGAIRTTNGAGNAGIIPGGGGGGGRTSGTGTTQAGGVGGRGQVLITYTCPTYSLTSITSNNICTSPGTTTVTLTSSAAGLPTGTYTVIYNTSNPSQTSLTATMTVTTAGSGTFMATGLTIAGSSTIEVTNMGSGSGNGVDPLCSNSISANNQATISVTDVPTQPSAITGNTAVCQGSSQTYSVTNVSGVTYTWTLPSGWTGYSTTNSITVTVGSSSGTISVTPSNGSCGGTARTLPVTVSTSVPAQPSAITGNTTPTVGNSETYSVTNVAGVTYTWTFPSGWTQTGGGTSNSVAVTVGGSSGNVQVTPSNGCGDGTARTLAVTPVLTYCTPAPVISTGYITNVTFNTINNSTGLNTYTYYTAISTNVTVSTSYNLSVTIANNGYTRHIWSWVDWNQDGDFLDTGEAFDLGQTNSSPATLTTSISVPSGATLGSTRMRVSVNYDTDPTSCEDGFYSEVEDYSVNVQAAGPAITSTSPGSRCGTGEVTVSATASSGTINWYASSSSSTSLWSGPSYQPDINTTTTYWVDATFGGVTSSPKVSVTAYIITPPSITAGGGGTFCYSSNVNLSSTPVGGENLYWTGPNDYYSTSEDPTLTAVTTTNSGTYIVHNNALSYINLVVNGDFENGISGITSSYTHHDSTAVLPACYSSAPLGCEGTYSIVASPHSVHPNFDACADHTTGTGKYQMVINGASGAGVVIWSQTVNTVPDNYYQFTYWVQSVFEENPSQLQLYVTTASGTVNAGPVYEADLGTCTWKKFLYNWNSGTATWATLALINQNTAASGNDFALDDIVFQHTCTDSASVVVTVNNQVIAGAITTTTPNPICTGATPNPLTSTAGGDGSGSGTISYQWQSSPDGTTWSDISGATSASYSPPSLTSTTYYHRRTVSVSGGITCYSAYTNTLTITVSAASSVEAGGPNAVCQSATPSFFALAGASYTGGTGAAWSYVSGGGTLSNTGSTTAPQNVTYTPAANFSGTATIRLTVNGSACYAVDDRIITVSATPTASASSDISTCTGMAAIAMTGATAGGTNSGNSWSGGGGSGTWTQNADPALATFTPSTASGSFVFTLTVSGSGGCTGTNPTSTRTISWGTTPTATAGSDISTCSTSGAVNITAGSSATNYSSIAWTSSGTGTFANANSLTTCTYTPSLADISAGSVTLTLTANGNSPCGSVFSTKNLTIDPAPTVSNSPLSQTICSGESSTLITLTSDVAGATFSWTASATAGVSGFTSSGTSTIPVQTISTSASSQGTVTYAITPSASGCTGSVTNYTILVNTLPQIGTFN